MSEPDTSAAPTSTVEWRLWRLERTVEKLEAKVDRLTFAIVTGAISVAVSVTVYVLTQT